MHNLENCIHHLTCHIPTCNNFSHKQKLKLLSFCNIDRQVGMNAFENLSVELDPDSAAIPSCPNGVAGAGWYLVCFLAVSAIVSKMVFSGSVCMRLAISHGRRQGGAWGEGLKHPQIFR